MFKTFFKKIYNDEVGNVLMVTSVAAPVMIGFAGLSLDVGHGLYSKSKLRGAAELTALDIAENYTNPNNFTFEIAAYRNHDALTDDAISFSKGSLPSNHKDAAIKPEDIEIGEWDIESKIFTPGTSGPIVNAARVKGELSSARQNKISTIFGDMFGFNPDLKSEALAIAPLIPSFHFLNPHASGALSHTDGNGGDRSDIDIGDIWINSDADDAMIASQDEVSFGATGAYIKGGATLDHHRYHEDLFRLPDLIAGQSEPSRPLLCDHRNREIDTTGGAILRPGTYCGGLNIKNAAYVYFYPGVYKFLDKPLKIDASTNVYGLNVLFHFDGPGAALDIQHANLFLSGRNQGNYKGFLVFSSRASTRLQPSKQRIAHKFNQVRAEIVGLIYSPDNDVEISGSLVNGNCHSLCLVANTMSVTNNSNLNWYTTFKTLSPFMKTQPRIAPTALEPYLNPYLISS